jgi:hypothetical protein
MPDLWSLVWGKPEVDPDLLAQAVEQAAGRDGLDFRTRLLIRDATDALEAYWGPRRLREWLERSPARARVEGIRREYLGEPGFPLLKEALVERTDPETVRQFLRDLGAHLHRPARIHVGGSIALILPEYLARSTRTIEVIDEVPAEVRSQHQLLEQLARRYKLQLTHFQSHFLPAGWEERVHSLEPFGQLQVYLVDVHDVFLSKLFSNRTKDLDDLRALLPQLDRETLVRRFLDTTTSLRQDPALRKAADHNWYVLTGGPLPG